MSFFDQIFTRLFKSEEASQKGIHVNETLKRSQSFIDGYLAWKESGQANVLLDDLQQSYFWRKSGVEKSPQMTILESTYSNGISIDYESTFGKSNFKYLFDFMADQVKILNYRPVMSRRSYQESDDGFNSTEMHYLKPKMGFEEPIDQKFGNVQIEFVEKNDEPIRIKLLANSYPDRKYKTARKFDELVQSIFQKIKN